MILTQRLIQKKIVYLINNKSRTLAKYIVKSYLYTHESIYRYTVIATNFTNEFVNIVTYDFM
jgi:hypothetical protein